MLESLRIRGPFKGPTGYDHHVRELVRALSRRGVRLQLESLHEWTPAQLPHSLRDPWFESLSRPIGARTLLQFCLPNQVRRDRRFVNVNFTMFEAASIPSAWAQAQDRADLIVVPAEASLRAWLSRGVPETKLRLCPLGVRADLFRPGVPPLALGQARGRDIASYAVRLLNVSEMGPRKNLKGLLAAWLRATSPHDEAVLILKVGCYVPGTLSEFREEQRQACESAGKSFEDAAPVHFIFDVLPDANMPRLFASATHYVSLSFGEGWDLAMIEAAAAGLRLIAPAHSGYLAYLDEDIAGLIPSHPAPAGVAGNEDMQALFGETSWWQPDEDAAADLIRRAIAGRDVPAASARERVRTRFSWDAAAGRLIEILDEAEAMSR